jgi:hypothetical protein
MGTKAIAFSGYLAEDNSIQIEVDQDYCAIRYGIWQMRFDSLSIIISDKLIPSGKRSMFLQVASSLLESPAYQTVTMESFTGQRTQKRQKVLGPTPLHMFTVKGHLRDKVQLIYPGTTQFDHQFYCGNTNFKLYFSDIEKQLDTEVIPLQMFVCGILHFSCVCSSRA